MGLHMEKAVGFDSVDEINTLSVWTILNVSMSVEKWLLTDYLLKVATNCAIL